MKNKILYLLLHTIPCFVYADFRDTINLLLPTSQNSNVNNKAVFYSVDVHFGLEASSIKTETLEILHNALFDNDITIKGNLNLSGAILKDNKILLVYDTNDNLFVGTKTINQPLAGQENIALGNQAGSNIVTGSNNILIGNQGVEPESDTIRIGNASHTGGNFQASIYNMTAANTNTSAVSVDDNGQLGTGIIYNDINLANTDSTSGAILKNGTLWLHNSGFTENTFLGKDAGNRYVNGGQNTAIGAYSGYNLYTAYDNTLVGFSAGENLIAGAQNSAVGVRALRWNISGSHNTAVGFESGYTINNGHNNTLVGDSAGYSMIDASDNIAVGYLAGCNVVTGSNNILIGSQGVEPESDTIRIGNASHTGGNFQASIYNMTAANTNTSAVSVDDNGQLGTGIIYNDINLANTNSTSGAILKDGTLWLHNFGTNNTFLGINSGNRTVTGNQNVGYGDATLINVTSGTANCAIGVGALQDTTSGNRNTAIGYQAGINIASGTDNLAVGYQAGSAVTTGSNDILIANVGVATESNTIRIGNSSHTGGNFQASIYNMTAANTNTAIVSVDNNGQLGTGIIYNDINLANTNSTSGAILKDGTLWLHNFGTNNTFLGINSGNRTVTGNQNVTLGNSTLTNLTSGSSNTVLGFIAGNTLTSGGANCAIGAGALQGATSGNRNTVIGYQAGINIATGTDNIAVGYQAGSAVTTGSNDILIANVGVATESNTIRIGNSSHTDTFLSGNVDIPGYIYAHTFDTLPTLTVGGTYTLIWDTSDNKIKRYAVASSKRFKENIKEISKTTLNNFKLLNGVEFSYIQDARKHKQYGFIAEEVNEAMPELIVYDIDGKIFSVNYSVMYALLQTWMRNLQAQADLQSNLIDIHENTINNLQTQIDEQLTVIADQQMTINSMIARLVALENYLAKQADSTFQLPTVDTTDNGSEQIPNNTDQNYNDTIVSIYDTE